MPAQYVARKFRAGGVKGSIFTLMSAILGAGILTLPYAVYANGLILGPILIIIGALLSYYAGYLLVRSIQIFHLVSGRLKIEQRALRGHRAYPLRLQNVCFRCLFNHRESAGSGHRLHRAHQGPHPPNYRKHVEWRRLALHKKRNSLGHYSFRKQAR